MLKKWILLLVVSLGTLGVVACGDDDGGGDGADVPTVTPTASSLISLGTAVTSGDGEAFFDCEATHESTTPDEAAFPARLTDPSGREVTIDEPPVKIASLSAGHTEVLFAIGAGDQVSAVDNTSNCPTQVVALSAMVDAFNPSVEAITALEPDLIVLFYDPGDLVTALEAAGATVLMMTTANDIGGVYDQIVLLGHATGHVIEAEVLVGAMKGEIDAIVAENVGEEGPTVYHELDNTYFSAGPGSFVGDLYETLGAENIATATGEAFPQLSAEAIIAASPEVIILADEGFGEDADTVAARPGWDAIAAVQNDRVFGIDPDIISRPGPRIVDAVRSLAASLYGEGSN